MPEERKRVAATRGLRLLEAILEGRTQKDFGDETGIPQSALSEILNLWRLPTLEQAVKLAPYGIPPSAWTESAERTRKGAA
jgi:transcriptional regulator with XRE-family HTH domain